MRRLPKIHKAAEVGDVAGIEARLAAGENVDRLWAHNFTPLHHAAQEGHVEAVRCLLKHGADPSWPDSEVGSTPLHCACVTGHGDCTRELVRAGADVNAADFSGEAPIIYAACSVVSQPDILRFLAEHGADVKHVGSNGTTALHEAARCRHHDDCEVLLELGADPRVRDDEGMAPDDIALFAGDIELCQALRALYWDDSKLGKWITELGAEDLG